MTTNVNGLDRNNNGTKTDGATNVNIWLPHHTMIVSPAETVDTVNVSTSNFDAEQGMAGGAAITVITKSGTNNFKGSAFAFYNNENLNAKAYFATVKNPASAHIDGATIGGPIQKNRLFFFGAWEGQYQTTPQQFFYNVPPPALRVGDFSQAFNPNGSLQVIYDPRTGNPDGTGRVPFPGNVIPADLIDPIAKQIQNLYPLPNADGSTSGGNVGGTGFTRNFERSLPRKFDRNNYDLKMNWNPSSAAQVWGKYEHMGANVKALDPYLPYNDRGNGDTHVNMYTFGTTWTINSTTVIDATYGISRMTHETIAGDFSFGNYGLDVLGIPGMNGGANFSSDPRYAGIPIFNTGFDPLGNGDGWDPVNRDERTYALSANITKVHGPHEIRSGYSVNRLWMEHWQPELGVGPRGQLDGATNATGLKGGPETPNLYNQYAAFLLGLVGHAGESVQNELMTTREWQNALYVRDRWQVNTRLTLDLGLRYEYYPLMTRADRGIERIDGANDLTSTRALTSLNVLLGGLGDVPTDLGIKVSKSLFAPRLGAIYRLNDETVFRTGYGITYNPLPFSRPLRGFYPLTLASEFTAVDPYGVATTFEQGIPNVVGPDESSGHIPLPNSYLMRSPMADVSRSRIQSWNAAIERRLPYDVSVDVAYVGTAKSGGFADIDANASDVPGGGAASQPFFHDARVVPDSVLMWGPITKSRYNSLQVAINRPFTKGLLLKGAYTLSRAKDETDQDGWDEVAYSAPSLLSRNYALAGYDRPNVFQMAFVYELPYKTKGGSGNEVMRAVFGDWQVNGIYTAASGTPLTMTASGADLNMPGNMQTANLNGSYNVIGDKGNAGFYFDPTAFSQPTGTSLGNTGRNQFRGPGYWNVDASLFRGSRSAAAGKRAEFRVEAFNLFNHPRWGNPVTDVTSSTFGRTFTVGDSARDFGSGERQIRLGVRFQF